jgi:hypothetical protein
MLSLYNNKLNGILADEMGLGKTVQVCGIPFLFCFACSLLYHDTFFNRPLFIKSNTARNLFVWLHYLL